MSRKSWTAIKIALALETELSQDPQRLKGFALPSCVDRSGETGGLEQNVDKSQWFSDLAIALRLGVHGEVW